MRHRTTLFSARTPKLSKRGPHELASTGFWGGGLGAVVLGICGEGIFIFRELGITGNYFRGANS